MEIYGTIGPSCSKEAVLYQMFCNGMTGARLNLSHTTLRAAIGEITAFYKAADRAGIQPKLLIDLQGPELRVRFADGSLHLLKGQIRTDIPLPAEVYQILKPGMRLLMDDGRLQANCVSVNHESSGAPIAKLEIIQGGMLQSGKSIAIDGYSVSGASITKEDFENLQQASSYGVTGVMLPFVRTADDLISLRKALKQCGNTSLRVFAKIENQTGVQHLASLFPYCDEIVIARGDLGNSVPLWTLPRLQKHIAAQCRQSNIPFMVVTQMLQSMEHSPIPTRAEVSDIYNAVLDGASSLMVTGETAIGEYPAEVIQYLTNTAKEASDNI